eukprot:TRINITY_DN3736_c0_g1_i1.p1 TRINITY_DN3736_c0_g1~~TRINITY_DN3736_c0_g1_i1.p1  ORF type:complete len:220 (-),score=41.33 TRINITY_DN3736_c0_g1_i1:142-801(-)
MIGRPPKSTLSSSSAASDVYKRQVHGTSIINRFIYDTFVDNDQPTVGIDFIGKTLTIDGQMLKLQLWDTAGQERFKSLIPSYIRDSDVVLIVYDVLVRSSYENIEMWMKYVRETRGNDIIVLLIGNKIDDEKNRQVTIEEGNEKGLETSAPYFEVSAKEGTNISNLFAVVARKLIGGNIEQNEKSDTMQSLGIEKQSGGILLQQNQEQNDGQTKNQCDC